MASDFGRGRVHIPLPLAFGVLGEVEYEREIRETIAFATERRRKERKRTRVDPRRSG